VTLVLELDSLAGLEGLIDWAESLRVPVQDEMAVRLSDIVLQNFGDDGIDRPVPWTPLGPGYALRKHGGDRTPREVLSGELRSSIDVELGNPEQSRVFTENEYASEQQWGHVWGDYAVPPRPFFPLIGDETDAVLTPYSESEVYLAAELAVSDALASL
jgi:hypothetical protein